MLISLHFSNIKSQIFYDIKDKQNNTIMFIREMTINCDFILKHFFLYHPCLLYITLKGKVKYCKNRDNYPTQSSRYY